MSMMIWLNQGRAHLDKICYVNVAQFSHAALLSVFVRVKVLQKSLTGL